METGNAVGSVEVYAEAARKEYERSMQFTIAANRYGAARGRKNQILARQYRNNAVDCFHKYTELVRMKHYALKGVEW